MTRTTILALTALLAPLAPLQAQCPNTLAMRVPAELNFGPLVPCGSTDIFKPFLRPVRALCPTTIESVPAHDVEVAAPGSNAETVLAGLAAVRLYTFECKTKWFLFIPIGRECRLVSCDVSGVVPLLDVRPCR